MADGTLPIMAPAAGTSYRLAGLGCWARRDNLPRYGITEPWSPYGTACGAEPATDLGLCARHLDTIFPPEVRTHASRP